MLKIILLIIGAAIVAVLAFAATKPDTFRYTRSIVVDASPSAVFKQLNNPKASEKWSEWYIMDPDAAYTYEGPDSGVGATVSWDGKKSGAGKIVVAESQPNSIVRLAMDFYKPMAGKATTEYVLTPEGSGTRVDFAMYGDQNYVGKLMSVFINCEKMIGNNTEKSLANMERFLKEGR